ncbi:MAG: Na+/H+ antiporter NhaA [Moraxellaceae bacterium]
MTQKEITRFLLSEIGGGLLLISAALLAIIFANTALVDAYEWILSIPVQVRVNTLDVNKPLLLWINDGMMALFFLTVGLEIKKEFLYGDLRKPSQIILPAAAALGGIAIPALVFLFFNYDNPVARHGWAIPSATDIAFALGVLALLGDRVPPALKIFVMTLAVLDDLGAVVIIALFYTSELSLRSLYLASMFTTMLFLLNRFGYRRLGFYLIAGLLLWVSVLKSGVHATLAGIVIAMALPTDVREGEKHSPADIVLESLHPWIVLLILPAFAFANAGVSLAGLSFQDVFGPIPLGIAMGLFIGKQVGIFAVTWLLIRLGLAKLPPQTNWMQMYGAAVLCGIGFTMSLFISSLAFAHTGASVALTDRLGVLMGSLLSAIFGYLILYKASKPTAQNLTKASKIT